MGGSISLDTDKRGITMSGGTPPSIERDDKPEPIDDIEEVPETQASLTFGVDPKNIEIPEAKPEKPKYRFDEHDIQMDRALAIPGEVLAYERKLMALNRKDDAIKKRLEEIRNKTYIEVANEKESDKLKYQDQKSIDTEVSKRIEEKTAYKSLKADIYKQVAAETLEAPEGETGPKKYKNETARQTETTSRLLKHQDYIKMRHEIAQYVAKESEPGKQRYTNERSRETEVAERLQKNAEYRQLIVDEISVVNDTHESRAMINYFRNELTALGYVVEHLKVRLRMV